MKGNEEIVNSFKAMLRIIETTLSGKEVPFKIVDITVDDEVGAYALFDLGGERFFIMPDTSGNKVWIAGFPIENSGVGGLDSGYLGFPTEVAGVIDKYYREKPKGVFQHFDGIGDLGNVGLNEIIREEVRKVFESDYDYAAAEREYYDKEYYRQDMEEALEAEVSSALSFLQDLQGSSKKLLDQKGLSGTNPDVDKHVGQALLHINKAIEVYFESLSPEAKEEVASRLGEVKIGK
jgi:hypothetical protein